jgi:hypothetical protein
MEIHDEYKNVVIKTLGYGCQICFLTLSAVHITELRYSEPDIKTGEKRFSCIKKSVQQLRENISIQPLYCKEYRVKKNTKEHTS